MANYSEIAEQLCLFGESGVDPAPRRFKHPHLPPEIKALVETGGIAKMIGVSKALPPSVSQNIIHRGIIGQVIHEDDDQDPEDFVNTRRNIAVNTPLHPDEGRIQEVIKQTALNVKKWLKNQFEIPEERGNALIRGICAAINANARRNLENLDKRKIVYIREGVLRSPAELAAAVREISAEVCAEKVRKEDAIVALLWRLGAYTDEEINQCPRKDAGFDLGSHNLKITMGRKVRPITEIKDLLEFDLSTLAKELEASLVWAKEFLDDQILSKRIKPLIGRYAAKGQLEPGAIPLPSLNQDLNREDFFSLFHALFVLKPNTRDANDLQMLTTLPLCHWAYQRRRNQLEHTHEIARIEEKFSINPYEPDSEKIEDATPDVLAYDAEREEYYDTGYKMSEECRYWKAGLEFADIPREKRIVNRSKVGTKSIPAAVVKHYNPDRTNRAPHEVPDEVRARIVAWRITSTEFKENPRYRAMFRVELEHLAKELDLSKWEIEDDFDKSYSKMTLVGTTKKGVNVEIQILPIDTYQFDYADESGTNHELLEELRELKYALTAIPYSVSPVTHLVVSWRIAEIEAYREKCFAAQKRFLGRK